MSNLPMRLSLKEAGDTKSILRVFFSFSSRSNRGINEIPIVTERSRTSGV
jgi:hypothetical protein